MLLYVILDVVFVFYTTTEHFGAIAFRTNSSCPFLILSTPHTTNGLAPSYDRRTQALQQTTPTRHKNRRSFLQTRFRPSSRHVLKSFGLIPRRVPVCPSTYRTPTRIASTECTPQRYVHNVYRTSTDCIPDASISPTCHNTVRFVRMWRPPSMTID